MRSHLSKKAAKLRGSPRKRRQTEEKRRLEAGKVESDRKKANSIECLRRILSEEETELSRLDYRVAASGNDTSIYKLEWRSNRTHYVKHHIFVNVHLNVAISSRFSATTVEAKPN